MAKYNILIKRSAQKELETLPKIYLVPITKLIASLANNPRPNGSEKLSGDEKYRIRKGPYRIIYSIHENELVIWVVKIAHRKQAYR
ncbi:MAG: type II toxin-antitoxin system RelE/ParE family toxin [Deltaproteobacteria bacterium]|nr:type II toxin-antitoxin system RelE/ParE family toxin [Deltaproteobacteria bacterium]